MSENNRPEVELPQAEPQPAAPQKKAKKKKGYVKYSPLSLILLAVCAFVFSFSLFGLFEQSILDLAGQSEVGKIGDGIFDPLPDDGGDPDDNSIIPSGGGGEGNVREWEKIAPEDIDTESLPYLQTLRFDSLWEQNADTVAWMYWGTTTDVKGLPFNMPVVQTENNEFYLSRSFDKSSNANGWIYADYRCDMSNLTSNRNTIIYGHARSYLMFGGLRYLNTKSKWQQDGYNHFIYLNTPTERTVWQVFAWYETTTAFNYINTYFSGDSEYLEFLNTLQSKNSISAFESFNFTPEDRILTLSTCKGSNSDVRIAIHAVLVKHERIGESAESTDSPDGMISGSDADLPGIQSGVPSTDGSEDSGSGADLPGTQSGDPSSDDSEDSGSGADLPGIQSGVPSTDGSEDSGSDADLPGTQSGVPSSDGSEDSGSDADLPGTQSGVPSSDDSEDSGSGVASDGGNNASAASP